MRRRRRSTISAISIRGCSRCTIRRPGDPSWRSGSRAARCRPAFVAETSPGRGFDHGTWVPLLLAYPGRRHSRRAGVGRSDARRRHHLDLGAASRIPARRDVLVIGSGSFTHNLREAFDRISSRASGSSDARPGSRDFVDWMGDRLVAGDRAALADYRRQAPFAEKTIRPTSISCRSCRAGRGGAGATGEWLHASRDFGVLSMDAFAFR